MSGGRSRCWPRYGDASNFFGDVETIRHKVQVLEDACEKVGRDPAEITKTRLGGIIVGETAEEAERKLLEFARIRGMDEERARWYAVYGDRDAVGEQVQAYLDGGPRRALFNMHDAWELERVALTGEVVSQVLQERRASRAGREGRPRRPRRTER